MRTTLYTLSLAALIAASLAPRSAAAQERRDTTRRTPPAASAEDLHRIRRAWLEQRRLGELGTGPVIYGSAVVGAPRPGIATGVGAPIGEYADPYGPPGRFGAAPFGFGPGSACDGSGRFPGDATGRTPETGFSAGWPCGPHAGDRHGLGPRRGDGLPYPAYPQYGRFYDRFNPDARTHGGLIDPLLFGIQEYDWGWYGPRQTYPGSFGWSDGAYGWYTASPWSRAPSDCIDLTLLLANGRSHRLLMGLQSLGLADARDLDLAIDARLSEGRPVLLQGLDGHVLRIEPGTPIDDIIVRPCGA